MTHLILIRHSGMRQIDRAEVRLVLRRDQQSLTRDEINVDTVRLAAEVEAGAWDGHDALLREEAAKILGLANASTEPELHYYGLAQIPHVIALGSHLGDERFVHLNDYHRDTNSWDWPQNGQTLQVVSDNVPIEPAVTSRGLAVIRVSISANVTDNLIRPHVGGELLADVTIRPRDVTPNLGLVRSEADVAAVRAEIRRAIGGIRAWRPGVHTIHLFVAAPVSVCFVLGQEIKTRNSLPVQTYRFRVLEGTPEYLPAVLLGASSTAGERALTDDQKSVAQEDRSGVWGQVLVDVIAYADSLRKGKSTERYWYDYHQLHRTLAAVAPFPTLRPLADIDCARQTVDPVPFHGEYGFDRDNHRWQLGNGLVLGFREAVEDQAQLRDAIRLFFFHELCHAFHGLTKYTVGEVGKFANCLEYLDYTADTFALLHQLDWMGAVQGDRLSTDAQKQEFLANQIDLMLLSFWAFDPEPPIVQWQVRRLRRYLNWYWRMVQIRRANTLQQALMLFRRQPHVELAGLQQFPGRQRILVRLDRPDQSTQLELAIVLEDERLYRVTEGPNASLQGLLDAFMKRRHEEILQFFRTIFEGAEQMGGALPKEDLPHNAR